VALGAGTVAVLAAAGLFMMRHNKAAQAQAERIMANGKGTRDE
jgi:putative membrane protein